MKLTIIAFLTSLLFLQGCAAVAVTAGGIAAGVGVNHTLSGIAYKTVLSPIQNTRLATLKTLNRMQSDVTKDEQSEEGWIINADATNRDIIIELEKLSETTTRMRVTVNKEGGFLKDRATATEIIAQSVQRLNESSQDRATKS